jgi:drug/metabolite transporter (DMT)-like permease
MQQLPYLAGLGLDAVGWVLSLLALQRLPLFAVQAAVASSVAVTVVLAALVLHERISRRQLGALITLGVGLILLAASAAPDSAASISTATEVALLVGVLVVGVAGLATMPLRGANGAGTLGALSGLAFGGTAICARALESVTSLGDVLRDPLMLGILGYGALGLVFYAAALERGSVTIATSCQVAVETVVPAVIGLTVLGDRARNGLAGVAATGFLLTVAAAVVLTLVSPPEPEPASPGEELAPARDPVPDPAGGAAGTV